MPRYSIEGVILKYTNYKDSDRIYTIFTKNKGKISATAKGVRKISSRRGGNLDTLNHVVVGISESERGFKTITEVKTLNSFKNMKDSLDNSVRGFYMAELVYKLLEDYQENANVFNLLVDSLTKLDIHLNNEVSRINAFEIKLMKYLGYGLQFDRCVKTGRVYDGTWETVRFSLPLGGFVSDDSATGVILKKEVADLLYSFATKKGIKKELLEDKMITDEANSLIKNYVRNVLERELNVERMFNV